MKPCIQVAIAIHIVCNLKLVSLSPDVTHYWASYDKGRLDAPSSLYAKENGKLKWVIDRQNDVPPPACGGFIDANKLPNGTIVFQLNSDMRQSKSGCQWILRTKPGHKIVGEFTDFSVGNGGHDCTGGDFLKVGGRPYVVSGEKGNEVQQQQTMGNKEIEKYKSMKYCNGNIPGKIFQSVGDQITLDMVFQHQNRNLQVQDSSINNIDEYKSNISQEGKASERKVIGDYKHGDISALSREDSNAVFTFKYWIETNKATCGDRIQESQFLFQSLDYPSPIPNETNSCGVTVDHDCENPVCQLRLDLIDFDLSQPDLGDCNRDQFIVRADEPLPVLCGKNSGQHLFVDVRGRKETDINLLTSPTYPKPVGMGVNQDMEWLDELTGDRKWNIRVTQIPCDCSERPDVPEMEPAPAGCLQHFRGIAGKISSFNYDGIIRNLEPCYAGINNEVNCNDTIFTGHLNNLDYTICIAPETGYCGIAYSPRKEYDVDGGLAWSGFQMDGTAYERRHPDLEFAPNFGESQCKEDYIQIPRGHHAEDVGVRYPSERYCGVKFGNRVEGAVISNTRPMIVRVKMDGQELESGVATNDRGFNLNYQQIPCSASHADAINFT